MFVFSSLLDGRLRGSLGQMVLKVTYCQGHQCLPSLTPEICSLVYHCFLTQHHNVYHNLFSCIFPQGSITLIKAGKYNLTIIKLLLLYHSCFCLTIVEPVLSSTVLSGNPLSSGLFSKSYSDVETNEKQHRTYTTESRPQNGQQNTNACKSNHCPIPHNQKQGEKSFHTYCG